MPRLDQFSKFVQSFIPQKLNEPKKRKPPFCLKVTLSFDVSVTLGEKGGGLSFFLLNGAIIADCLFFCRKTPEGPPNPIAINQKAKTKRQKPKGKRQTCGKNQKANMRQKVGIIHIQTTID